MGARLARRTRGFCGDATDLDVNAPPAWRQRLGRGLGEGWEGAGGEAAGGDLLEDAGVAEEGLVGPDGTTLPRASAQRAFWFGWRAQYPETLLVQ